MNYLEKSLELAKDYFDRYKEYSQALEKTPDEHINIVDLEQKKDLAWDEYYKFLKNLSENNINILKEYNI